MTFATETPLPDSTVYFDEPDAPSAIPVEVMIQGVVQFLPRIGLLMVLALFLVAGGLHFFAEPIYTAKMRVAPYVDTGSASASLASKTGASQIASLLGSGDSGLTVNFSLYNQTRTSTALAQRLFELPEIRERLFPEQWDSQTRQWRARHGFRQAASGMFKAFFGLPGWSPPTANDLAAMLAISVKADKDVQTGSYTISFANKDPAFAVHLLTLMHETDEAMLRDAAQKRASIQIAHLLDAITNTSVAENRSVLTELLLQLQQQLAKINPQLPYAALLVDPPVASHYPTSPKPLIDMLIGAVLAGLAGAVWGAFRAARAWKRDQV